MPSAKAGFLFGEDSCVVVTADILILSENVGFVRDSNEVSTGVVTNGNGAVGDVLSGKFT